MSIDMVVHPLDFSALEVVDENRQDIRLCLSFGKWTPWVLSMMNYPQVVTIEGNNSGSMWYQLV